MKKAIGYIRISNADQSNFSLDGQEKYIRDFAAKNDYELLNVYRDEGRSAKNFDRPDWKLLQQFCKQNHHQVDALIVAKYDRFSRNLKDSLSMIEMLEEKYHIRILSAMEPIMINPASPFFFQFRTQMLMGAQVEWLIIRDRTQFGRHHALKSGRYITTAPFGYINKRDEQNKPIILVDETKAPVVRKMYEMLLQGAPLKEIHLEARRKGYNNTWKGAAKSTLMNPTYAGLIHVPEYNDEPAHYVKGLHQGIIEESTWWQAQELLEPKKIVRTVMNEEVPLRSVLRCGHCDSLLTAGNSRGRHRYYWYYKCNQHPKINLNADKLHAQMENLWEALSLPELHIQYLTTAIEKQLNLQLKEQQALVQEKKRELASLQTKLENVEEKFINDGLDKAAYKKWNDRYQHEMAVCKKYIVDYSQPLEQVRKLYEKNLPKLENLLYLWNAADLHQKQALIRIGFNSSLRYEGGIYRTAFLLPVFQPKAKLVADLGLLLYEENIQKSAKNLYSAPEPTSVEPLRPLLQLLAQIKVA
jgi:site-specific DNA recombinase